MHPRLRYLSLAATTLLLSVTSPLLPLTSHLVPLSAQAQTTQDRNAEAVRLNQEGLQQFNRGQFREALENFQKVLVIFREISDRKSEGTTLNNMGEAYRNLGEYPKALDFYSQALAIHKQVSNKAMEGTTLNNMGEVYNNLGEYPKALDFYNQALAIHKQVGDKAVEGTTLNNMGEVYRNLGEYPKALDFYSQALAIHKQVGNKVMEGTTLNNIGLVYNNLGEYPKALGFYQQALAIHKQIGNKVMEGTTLNNIGEIYRNLGEYPKALDFYSQALAIHKQIGNKAVEGTTLNNIGEIYRNLGEYPKALDFYNQALAIHKQVGNKAVEGTTLNNIGLVYSNLGEYPKALEFYSQSLAIHKQTGNKVMEGTTLNNIGLVYNNLGEYPKALEFYSQALAIHKQVGNKAVEGITLSNIGYLLEKQNQPELAIVFYKQSVNVTEAIRQNIRVLPREQQQSYTQTVADTYRRLADLLLKQDRVLEAQKVLDLIKVQELEDYLRNVRGNEQTITGVANLPPEEQFNQNYNARLNKAIEFGKELTQLEKIPSLNRTPQQQQRITELRNNQEKILAEFNAFIRSPAVETIVQQLSNTSRRQNLELEDLNSLRDNLRKLEQNAVLLYPLILDDRLELVLVTADSPPIHHTVSVKREELNRAIAQFRTALENPNSDAKTPARQLYDWLIKPLENDLIQAKAQTLIYAPDGQLRYIPLAALYDGNQWLVQRFRVNNITARTLTDLNTKSQNQLRVLAGAFTKGNYSFNIGSEQFSFNGLPFAGVEVENLATELPGTTKLLDQAFSREGTVPRMNDYSIVHLATHAAFVKGKPEDSFVLFGDGSRVTLRDIENWSLPKVDLVVLSACETGVGGFGNGEEILGLGYQVQRTGARAAIASLWSVSDGGTQALMDAFYAALQTGQMTKAEALRQAQVALITGDYKALGQQRGLEVQQRINRSLSKAVNTRLSHPNYWAPFILIGNGL